MNKGLMNSLLRTGKRSTAHSAEKSSKGMDFFVRPHDSAL
jgi:hypothetical protein